MFLYEWVMDIPWHGWAIGFAIKCYLTLNLLLMWRQLAKRRAVSPYARPGVLTVIVGSLFTLPLLAGREIKRWRDSTREPISATRPQASS